MRHALRLAAVAALLLFAACGGASDPKTVATGSNGTADAGSDTTTTDAPGPTTTDAPIATTTIAPAVVTTAKPAPTTTAKPPPPPTTARPTTTTTAPPPPPVVTTAPPAVRSSGGCHSSYTGTCIPADVSDADCAGGSGNGPYYVTEKNIGVVGPDVFDLDRDGDGVGCES